MRRRGLSEKGRGETRVQCQRSQDLVRRLAGSCLKVCNCRLVNADSLSELSLAQTTKFASLPNAISMNHLASPLPVSCSGGLRMSRSSGMSSRAGGDGAIAKAGFGIRTFQKQLGTDG